MPVVYSFSAKSIQDYIFHSNQLKDMVAASEQIEQLCKPVLEGVLKALGLESKKPKFIRRAGGAFIIVLDDPADAKKLRDVWSFVVRRRFPGLLFNQFIKKYSQAADVLKDRNPPAVYSGLCPVFPIAGPLVARTPRLGEAAVEEIELKEDEGTERLDIATRQKREFLAQIDKKSGSLLEGKFFLKMDKSHKVAWPRHLDKRRGEHVEPRHLFPLLGENRYVGVVHADGNGFGVMMGKVKNTGSIEIYRAVSDSIAKIAERAARKATKDTLTEAAMDAKAGDFFVMPARPLILGGEDLTIIVRADLAIAFTKIYLEEFEQASEDILAALKEKYKQLALELPEILTACAGIAFIKASQPFHQACKLAESLCETAKRFSKDRKDQAENIPSSLAFHRITTSMIDEYPEIRRRELRIAVAIAGNQNSENSRMPSFPQTRESRRRPLDSRVRGNDESDIAAAQADSRFFTASTGVPDIEAEDAETENIWEIAMQPYAAGRIKPASHLPELNDLQHLCELLSGEQVSQGALRELMNLFYLSRPRAKSGLERWKENMEKTGQGEVMKSIFETLGKLLDEAEEDFPVIDKHRKTTPFGDALAWLAVARGNHD